MPKRRDAAIHNVLAWIARGYGQGEGQNYKSFLHVRDVPSMGRSSMFQGLKTGRTHYYLSDIEYNHHILAEYDSSVEDIREQFALLPWDETQKIAAELQIKHPAYPVTQTPTVMTTDMVLTLKGQTTPTYIAISIKHSSDLDVQNKKSRRTFEKLLIEKTYWERRGIPWVLSTEKTIPVIRCRNLDMLRTGITSSELDWLNPHMHRFIDSFNGCWKSERTFAEILERTSRQLDLSKEHCCTLFSRAVWLRLLPVDIDTDEINPHSQLRRKPLTHIKG